MPVAIEPAFSHTRRGECSVVNRSRASSMARQVRVCRSFFSRFLGLMFRRRLGEEQGALLVMTTTSRLDSAIHMFFVFFPLAVFWLDEEGQVISRILARPWRPFYIPQRPARYVLELSATRLDTALEGDRLGLEATGTAG